MKIAIEKFWCVKYYKAQPYNMEHTLCVCYNSVHDQVGRKIIKFVNDKYKISPAKRLEHVTPEELDSAFLLSKSRRPFQFILTFCIRTEKVEQK